MSFIVMGVSGSGKSTVGRMLAERCELPFFDADDFHPEGNIVKMQQGIPLKDEDRQFWLRRLSTLVQEHKNTGFVLACSALKEHYRQMLDKDKECHWIFLHGAPELLKQRLIKRKEHFMSSDMLESQIQALEHPSYGVHLDISVSPDLLVKKILEKVKPGMKEKSQFGIIGLGVMGKNLVLNLAGKEIKVSAYNRYVPDIEENVAKNFVEANPELTSISGFQDLEGFVSSLDRPRRILIMIKAGPAIDSVIESLLPLLDAGDVIMDGGNSHYKDTERRTTTLEEKGILFLGVGISGGEEGARKGPSLMPGGNRNGYRVAGEYLEKLAAKDKEGHPCCAYTGPDGAGHFIKMVHNGVEYVEMQLLAEAYQVMRDTLQMSQNEILNTFREWQKDDLDSFLLDITISILNKKESSGDFLLDKVLDAAEQKGTGSWSAEAALELGVPSGMIAEAVMARYLSARKTERVKASQLYPPHENGKTHNIELFLKNMKKAYRAARIINHHSGFQIIKAASDNYKWRLDLSEIARIWTNGCIIRSLLMEELVNILKSTDSVLDHEEIVSEICHSDQEYVNFVSDALKSGVAVPVFSSSLNYYLGYKTAESPANLIQAQRDFFGAHMYRRVDSPEDRQYHTEWE